MNEYLLRHAVSNVWCNPTQDRQFVYKLARLTGRRGVQGHFGLFYERLTLPESGVRYHIYQLGQVLPQRIGVPHKTRRWLSLAELANDYLLMSDIYLASGVQFPKHSTYVWITPSRNLIIAVKINSRIGDLEDASLYLRVYSNAFFNSSRSVGKRRISLLGQTVTNTDQIVTFQREAKDLVDQYGGYPWYFVNGRFVSNVSPITATVGDEIEFILDASIKRMVEFEIDDLSTFVSALDGEHKYILHYDDPSVNTIEYLDDVDIYLIDPKTNGRFMGVYYHHNEERWLRMLTHKDYSISVPRLESFVAVHPTDPRYQMDPNRWNKDDWEQLSGKRLRVYIREAGYERPLVPESHRIQELYRLTSEEIMGAMTGTNATLDIWRAENLETTPYVTFMSARPDDVYPITYNRPQDTSATKEAAQQRAGDVYGYHVSATILADTPKEVVTVGSNTYAEMAFEHRYNATVFEYDAQGVLLGWYYHVRGRHYIPRNSDTARVEAITGKGGFYNQGIESDRVVIPYGHNARLYVQEVHAGQPTGVYTDITNDPNRDDYGTFVTTDGVEEWVWDLDPIDWKGYVRIDDRFLCYDLELGMNNGHLRFSLIEGYGVGDRVIEVPYGQLDIGMNGRWLVEGVDYRIEWPEVVISNLEYLEETKQKFTIRAFGLSPVDDTHLPTTETGFVEYGVLSNDQDYDIHRYRVLHVVMDGYYRPASELVFDEQRNSMTIDGVRNGAPYTIKTPPVVMRDVYDDDQQARLVDDAIDVDVKAYMNEHYPPSTRGEPDFIETPYTVISVFANKLVHDLKENLLYPSEILDQYSDHDIREWCKPYEWLLPFDICNTEYDKVHLRVYPHWEDQPVELDIYQWGLLQRALALYLRYPPDIAPFISIA